jgi:hypothetical protein
VRSKYDFNTHETLYSSLGSDGVLVSALEWKLSNELKTRISTQMDVRNYDSDAHHFGISVEIL